MQDPRCHVCEQTQSETQLQKCPICFRYFCDEHRFNMSGRAFCTRGCADHFFFGDPDD